MKNKFVVLLIILTLLTAGAGGFIAYKVIKTDNDEITVDVGNGQTERVISVNELNLAPGGEKSVSIKFTRKTEDAAKITLEFEQTEDGELKNYVTVIIAAGDHVETEELKDLLGGKVVSFDESVEKMTITYKMHEDAGNEAQGAKIRFDVRVKVSTEE